MNKLTVTAKGQITLRKDFLRHLGAQPGEKLVVEELQDNSLSLRLEKRTGKIAGLFGMLKQPGRKPVPIEEINAAIADAWAGRQ